MSWNYRIMKGCIEDHYTMHEVFYNEEGEAHLWTKDPITDISAESVEELEDMIGKMFNDVKRFKNDILDYNKEEKKEE